MCDRLQLLAVERTLETVVEFQDAHTQRLTAMTESFEAALAKVISAIDSLTVQVVQMNAGIKQNSQNIDKLERQIDRIVNTFENQQKATNRQIDRIINTFENQQQATNKQIDRISNTLYNQQQLVNKQAAAAATLVQTVATLIQRGS